MTTDYPFSHYRRVQSTILAKIHGTFDSTGVSDVIDLGFGQGGYIRKYNEFNRDVIAVDKNPKRVKTAAGRLAKISRRDHYTLYTGDWNNNIIRRHIQETLNGKEYMINCTHSLLENSNYEGFFDYITPSCVGGVLSFHDLNDQGLREVLGDRLIYNTDGTVEMSFPEDRDAYFNQGNGEDVKEYPFDIKAFGEGFPNTHFGKWFRIRCTDDMSHVTQKVLKSIYIFVFYRRGLVNKCIDMGKYLEIKRPPMLERRRENHSNLKLLSDSSVMEMGRDEKINLIVNDCATCGVKQISKDAGCLLGCSFSDAPLESGEEDQPQNVGDFCSMKGCSVRCYPFPMCAEHSDETGDYVSILNSTVDVHQVRERIKKYKFLVHPTDADFSKKRVVYQSTCFVSVGVRDLHYDCSPLVVYVGNRSTWFFLNDCDGERLIMIEKTGYEQFFLNVLLLVMFLPSNPYIMREIRMEGTNCEGSHDDTDDEDSHNVIKRVICTPHIVERGIALGDVSTSIQLIMAYGGFCNLIGEMSSSNKLQIIHTKANIKGARVFDLTNTPELRFMANVGRSIIPNGTFTECIFGESGFSPYQLHRGAMGAIVLLVVSGSCTAVLQNPQATNRYKMRSKDILIIRSPALITDSLSLTRANKLRWVLFLSTDVIDHDHDMEITDGPQPHGHYCEHCGDYYHHVHVFQGLDSDDNRNIYGNNCAKCCP